MGVGKTMKIFNEAMQSGMAGFGSKIVTTAMGPFKWDDLQEMWVNVNNGFAMPNISMQDMLMYGYGDDSTTLSGDNGPTSVQICYENITSTSGTLQSIKPGDSYLSLIPLYSPTNPVEGCFGRFYIYKTFSQTLEELGIDIDITLDGTNYNTANFGADVNTVTESEIYTVGHVAWGTTVQIRVKPNATTISNGYWPVGTTDIVRGLRIRNYPSDSQILFSRFTTVA